MRAARRSVHAVARRAVGALPPRGREIAMALAARSGSGPAPLPGPPAGTVLVVAPHPDDETIGCGGALVRHVAAGDEVRVLLATSGESTGGGGGDAGAVARAREAECRAACAELGVPPPVFLHLPDGRLDDEVAALAAAIRAHGRGVATLYAPSPLDPHRDHLAACRAVADAALHATVMGYEVWSAAPVDVVLDVGRAWPAKEAALRRYPVALESVDYVGAAHGLARYRGITAGLGPQGLAEGFVRTAPGELAALLRR